MATNPPKGDGHRNGAVKQRSQTFNPKTDCWLSVMLKPAVSWMSSRMGLHLRASEKKSDFQDFLVCE